MEEDARDGFHTIVSRDNRPDVLRTSSMIPPHSVTSNFPYKT